jgi:hypothetical protein
MPESKIVIFDTKYKTPSGSNNITINMQPVAATPNIVEADMNFGLDRIFLNNKEIASGNLALVFKNSLVDIDSHIDRDGNLVANAEDSKNYRLDENGHLMYDYL